MVSVAHLIRVYIQVTSQADHGAGSVPCPTGGLPQLLVMLVGILLFLGDSDVDLGQECIRLGAARDTVPTPPPRSKVPSAQGLACQC